MIKILLKLPVPLVFVLTYLIGLLFQFNIHFPEFGDTIHHFIFLSGIILFVVGGIAFPILACFISTNRSFLH